MKRSVNIASMIFFLLLVVCPFGISAMSVTASWDPVTLNVDEQPEEVGGYFVYWDTNPRLNEDPMNKLDEYPNRQDAGPNESLTLTALDGSKDYYFAVTAYDLWGNESTFSEEVFIEGTGEEDPSIYEVTGGCNLVPASKSKFLAYLILSLLIAGLAIIRRGLD
jgi:hypothetical protein